MSATAEWTGQRKNLVHWKVKQCVTQSNQQRENRLKKQSKASEKLGIITKDLAFMSLEFQRWKERKQS